MKTLPKLGGQNYTLYYKIVLNVALTLKSVNNEPLNVLESHHFGNLYFPLFLSLLQNYRTIVRTSVVLMKFVWNIRKTSIFDKYKFVN